MFAITHWSFWFLCWGGRRPGPSPRPSGIRVQIEPYGLVTAAGQPAVDDPGGGDLEGGAAGGVGSVGVGDRGHAARVREVENVGRLALDDNVGMKPMLPSSGRLPALSISLSFR